MLPAKEAIIDGEITALDDKGKSSFQLLQSYGSNKEIPVVYYAFDLISLEGTRPARPTTYRVPQAARPGKSCGQYLIFRTTARFGRRVPPRCASIPARGLDRLTAGFNL
jgi:hypothetical protein